MDLKLPRLISDGMILQRNKKIHIWGFHKPEQKVMVSFLNETYTGITNVEGIWEVFIKEQKAGGPYVITICDEQGNEVLVQDVLIGEVWICSGQSNMELPMQEVKDIYEDEIANCENTFIRTFKVIEHANFHAPINDHLTGEWKEACKEHILNFSATAYFFAKQLYEMTKIPIGLINVSLGGSPIESWMSREMLVDCQEALNLADQYADDEFIKERARTNQQQTEEWHHNLDNMDVGRKEHWEQTGIATDDWNQVQIPFFFRDTDLNGFIGSVWFRRSFQVPDNMEAKSAHLWLGTIVDSDMVYVNGVFVGQSEHQYLPRKYQIPEGILKKGQNEIVICVKCENGLGRFTIDKKYAIWNEQGEVDLEGQWNYHIGADCEPIKPTDFINWKPVGLFNGMMAPCCRYTITGFIWYQGESNTGQPEKYTDLMERMIEGYRSFFQDESLPFFYVQLPNYSIEASDDDQIQIGEGWPGLREAQREALSIPGTGMAVAIDLGEDNDLHPLNKKDVGYRLSMLAANRHYGMEIECEGPQISQIVTKAMDERKECQVEIFCNNIQGGMYVDGKKKGNEITDFELQDGDGQWYSAKAWLDHDKICLKSENITDRVIGVRYCYANTNSGGLIYNQAGFPFSPFYMKISGTFHK